MLPTIALVGRPNVGKSTLFNKLTNSRDALVADVPGLTRDRRYGRMEMFESHVTLIDTGGLFGEHVLADELTGQTQLAVDEADLVLLLFDGRDGVTASDEEVVTYLRKSNVAFLPVINKIDGLNEDQVIADFVRFGFPEYALISASHNRGLKQLRETMAEKLSLLEIPLSPDPMNEPAGIRVAVVGRIGPRLHRVGGAGTEPACGQDSEQWSGFTHPCFLASGTKLGKAGSRLPVGLAVVLAASAR